MKKNILDVLTEFRVYFRATITNRIDYCLTTSLDEDKTSRFEDLQKQYIQDFVNKCNSTDWENEAQTLSPEIREEFAMYLVDELLNKYYNDLKTYNIMVRRELKETE